MGNDAYGGTFRLISKVLTRMGVTWSAADFSKRENIENCVTDRTRVIWAETPSNPLLSIVDIQMLSEVAHSIGAWCVVDNTFATPYLQQPLAHGADFVVHSATKYLGGHSDVVGGFIATNSPELDQEIGFLQNAIGAVPAPWDCYLLLRGVKTLSVRMDRHCENSKAVAEFLSGNSDVEWVRFPGLAGDPAHSLNDKYIDGKGGSMVVFGIKGGSEAGSKFIDSLELFSHLANVGDAKSLAIHPATTTHSQLNPDQQGDAGISPELVRLSIGIEHIDDIIEDIDKGLAAAK